jgi:hypothetical protein
MRLAQKYPYDDVPNLLNAQGGMIDGEQTIHPCALAAALQLDPTDRGLSTSLVDGRYNASFWARRYGPNQGYSCSFWIPYMSGYSL